MLCPEKIHAQAHFNESFTNVSNKEKNTAVQEMLRGSMRLCPTFTIVNIETNVTQAIQRLIHLFSDYFTRVRWVNLTCTDLEKLLGRIHHVVEMIFFNI